MFTPGSHADVGHIRIIRQHYVFLVDNLDAKHSGLVDEVYQADVISAQEKSVVDTEIISYVQNEKLLSVLSRKTKEQFDKFLNALDKTGQQHIRKHISGHPGTDNVFSVHYVNIQETQDVPHADDISRLSQLQQQLQQANETIVKLQEQLIPTCYSQSKLSASSSCI